MMETMFGQAMPGILQGVAMLIITGIVGGVVGWLTSFRKEHKSLLDSQDKFENDYSNKLDGISGKIDDMSDVQQAQADNINAVVELMNDMSKAQGEMSEEQRILVESQRHQIKNTIVYTYQKAAERGSISHMDLETMNRLGKSYFDLKGNTYITSILDKAAKLPLEGEEIDAKYTYRYTDDYES